MMCQRCGKQLNNDFNVCPYCGNPTRQQPNHPQFQQNQQFNNYRNQQMPQGGPYNYGQQRQNPYTQQGNYYNANYGRKKETHPEIWITSLFVGILSIIMSFSRISYFIAIIAVVLALIGLFCDYESGKCAAGLVCGVIGFTMCAVISIQRESGTDSVNSESASEVVIERNSTESFDTEKEVEEMSMDEFVDSCKEFKYKKIARNPDDYIGKNFKVTVKIYSTSEGSFLKQSYMKAYTDNGDGYYFDKMIYLFDEQDENSEEYVHILEDDIVTVYGTFEGTVDSKNVLNGETRQEVALHVKYVELIEE